MEEGNQKEFIPNYGMEKEITVFNEDGSAYRIRVELMWEKERTLNGFKCLVKEAKKVLDSLLSNR